MTRILKIDDKLINVDEIAAVVPYHAPRPPYDLIGSTIKFIQRGDRIREESVTLAPDEILTLINGEITDD